jgi:hypothetical protein
MQDDLFYERETLESEVQDIINFYEEKDDLSKEDMIKFEDDLKPHGYTFDWGLDMTPFGLQKI